MGGTRGLGLTIGNHPCAGEVLVNLVVQVLAVCHHNKGPVAGHLAQDFLGKEHHRHALAATLGVPEYTQPAFMGPDIHEGLNGVVDAEKLVVFPTSLKRPPCASL